MGTLLAHAIIPARYASSRFPGKPLAQIHGKPMFWHVWHRASQCPALASVWLATDDTRIADAAATLGVPWVMTGTHHASGTDRVHEAARKLGLPPESIVLNVQGDEPALNPACLGDLVAAFADPGVRAATLARRLRPDQATSPDTVKVVLNSASDALYFSRAPIPFNRDADCAGEGVLGHVGLYAFRMETLDFFVTLPSSFLEKTEKLEQLRLIENGQTFRVVLTTHTSPGVDRPEHLEAVMPLIQCNSVLQGQG